MRGAQKAQPFGHPLDGRVRRQFAHRGMLWHLELEHSNPDLVGLRRGSEVNVSARPLIVLADVVKCFCIRAVALDSYLCLMPLAQRQTLVLVSRTLE
jgi:hypothetical protein